MSGDRPGHNPNNGEGVTRRDFFAAALGAGATIAAEGGLNGVRKLAEAIPKSESEQKYEADNARSKLFEAMTNRKESEDNISKVQKMSEANLIDAWSRISRDEKIQDIGMYLKSLGYIEK